MRGRRGEKQLCFVGVDGGGTKTHAVVTDHELNVLGDGLAGPSNFLRVGVEPAVAAVEAAVAEACARAGVPLSRVTAIGIGLAGVDHPVHRRTMREALAKRLPVAELVLVGDAQCAVAGATDLAPGVVVIAGTGSVALGVDAKGRMARSGGWGPTMGDEGSGYDIARRALAAVAGALDGRAPETSLTRRVCEHLGVAGPEDLPSVVYDPARGSQQKIASLGRLVAEEARAGERVAREIVERAGQDLAAAMVAVIRRLGLRNAAFPVAYVGGVFGIGDLILDELRGALAEVAPKAYLVEPLRVPAVGAARLAAIHHHELPVASVL
jgi:N-acetylglucosamine kinase-like BadF-type ATPase